MTDDSEYPDFQKDHKELASRRYPLPLIIILGAFLRFIGLGNNGLWMDELYSVWVSRLPADSFLTALSSWGHPPMYYLLGRVWFALGTSDAWSRSISAASGVAVIFLVFLVGKELFSRQVGLWGALLASLSPLLVSYSRDATYYSFLTALTLLSLYLLTRSAMRGGWLNWTLFTVISILAIFTHLFSFVLILADAGFFLILRGRDGKSLTPFLASQLTLVAAFALSWLLSHNANGLINIKLPLKILLAKLAIIPYVLLGGGFNDFGAGIGHPIQKYLQSGRHVVVAATLLLLLVLPLAVIFFMRIVAVRRTFLSKKAIALSFYILVLSVLPVIIHNVLDVPEQPSQRFYLWATPGFLLLASLLVVSLSARARVVVGAILIAGFSAMTIWGIFLYQPYDFKISKTPLTFVSSKYQSGDLLFCIPYDLGFLAAGHYYPESLKMGGAFLLTDDQRSGEYYFLPNNSDVYTLMTKNIKNVDERYLSSGEDLKRRTRDSIKDTDRVWFVVFKTTDGSYYCPGCDVLGSVLTEGWQEETWSFDTGNVHLYTRMPARM